MVNDGRKLDHPDKVETVTINPSLKLKINLRDRQSIRKPQKRNRSSSPTSSNSSSTQDGSTRMKHQTGGPGPNRALSFKGNRKEVHQQLCSDEFAEEPCTPSPSIVGSPVPKRNKDAEVKKVKEKNNCNSSESVIMLVEVDMNKGYEKVSKAETQLIPNSSSPPESSVEKEANTQVTDKLQAQPRVDAATCDMVKRLTRDELERLVMEQMCLAIRERGITAELERKLEASDAQLEVYRLHSEALHKRVSDFGKVLRKHVQQSKGSNQPVNPPIKKTRSVGLQIDWVSRPSIAVQKPLMPEPKSSVTVVPTTNKKTISTSPQTAANATIISPTGSNNSSRVSKPPSFTMQSLDIASYVPQQAVPRRIGVPNGRSGQELDSAKVASGVTCGVKSLLNSSVDSMLQRNLITITPVISSGANQQPQAKWNPNTFAMHNRARAGDAGPLPSPTTSIPMARLCNKVSDLNTFTVNKVMPSIGDATAVEIPIVPKPTFDFSYVFPNEGPLERVAFKSTAINGRNSLTNKPPNIQPHSSSRASSSIKSYLSHSATLPVAPVGPCNSSWKPVAPKPLLSFKQLDNGIALSWSWNKEENLSDHAGISSYQLFSYQEGSDPPKVDGTVWKKMAEFEALPLPMKCTLTQLLVGHCYHFAIRAIDIHGRAGPYSKPRTICVVKK